ncbi:MAG TPA: HAD family hydrolase [Rhodocyclaceae bacterium]|nr:HAD family hydrolase [Rhodocyclaceae bacterium]
MHTTEYLALATDYDGTIAHDGVVDAATLAALQRWRSAGKRLLLVTGRELDDLVASFPHYKCFDRIVAENGALLHDPVAQTTCVLAPPPPPALLGALQANGVPFSVGRSIVATVEPYEHALLAAIHALGLEWHVIFNKGSVMALPANITKETGLRPALETLGLTPMQTIGVGDAENDHAFLQVCGLSVAVDNALPSLKENVDIVTHGKRGQGIVELIARVLANDIDDTRRNPAHHITPDKASEDTASA